MQSAVAYLAGLSLAVWVYLLLFHGGFWRVSQRLAETPAVTLAAWPDVVAVVPARDEADVIGRAVRSLFRQDYPGAFEVVVVDDHSRDNTAEAARRAANGAEARERFTVVASRALPVGWSGKLWAVTEGLAHLRAHECSPAYLWLTDADVEHGATTLRDLVAKAETEGRNLVSLMVMLACRGLWERLLIPPFVFFFQKLYPFAWVNDPRRRTAAAAGGCILLRREVLERAGGLAPIRGELIDDCALARLIKHRGGRHDGGIWLGLTTGSHSIRPYDGLAGIWRMVTRTAYTQLRHSPLLLCGTILGMVAAYLVPPLALLGWPLHGSMAAAWSALCAWALMALAFAPTLRLYQQPVVHALLLPFAAALYSAMTIDSALRHRRGQGGAWKGRVPLPSARVARRPNRL